MRSHLAGLACTLLFMPCAMAQSRGELLYTTHCIACHTTQVHWRDQRSVVDWVSLQAQVRRWQGAASLSWGDSDIREVSRYLNDSIYRFELPAGPVGRWSPRDKAPAAAAARVVGL